jgi:hypothetical protein
MKKMLQMGKGCPMLGKPAQKKIKGGSDDFPLWDGDGYVVRCFENSVWKIVPNQAACDTYCNGQVSQCVPVGEWRTKNDTIPPFLIPLGLSPLPIAP